MNNKLNSLDKKKNGIPKEHSAELLKLLESSIQLTETRSWFWAFTYCCGQWGPWSQKSKESLY